MQSNVQPLEPSNTNVSSEMAPFWLHSAYESDIWIVSSSFNIAERSTIDFRYQMPDGNLLSEMSELYKFVKKYAFLVREDKFTRVDDSHTHMQLVRSLMCLAHALQLRGIKSFSALLPVDIDVLVEACRYGVDGLLLASERVETYVEGALARIAAAKADVGSTAFDDLADEFRDRRRTGQKQLAIAVQEICKQIGLPETTVTRLPQVVKKFDRIAIELELFPRYHKIEGEPEQETVSSGSIQRLLDPLSHLFLMRREFGDNAIKFNPFPGGVARVAKMIGVASERTPTPPPRLALSLFERSIKSIFADSSDDIANLEYAQSALKATACWVVIAAFTARRVGEIGLLRQGDLSGNERDGWWLNVYIEKTKMERQKVPVPSVVAKAFQVQLEISARARELSGDPRIFRYAMRGGYTHDIDVTAWLDEFARVSGLEPIRYLDGRPEYWHWNPHQFRRFFAILYFYRYAEARLEVLSYHLRHFSIDMTKRYVTTDPEVAGIWMDVEWGYMGDVARRIVAGDRSVAGAKGSALKKVAARLMDMFRRRVQVVDPGRAFDEAGNLAASVRMVMQKGGLVIRPNPWADCTCPHTAHAATKARCRSRVPPQDALAIGPDQAQALPEICSGCIHAILYANRRSYVERELEIAQVSAGVDVDSIFNELRRERVLTLERALGLIPT